jgi:hypothetical protein
MGNYESALEHLLAAQTIMDRSAVVFAWGLALSQNFGWRKAI